MKFAAAVPQPMRIRLSRAKGWRMPDNAQKVDRSTRWGNPFRDDDVELPWRARSAVQAFEFWLQRTADGQHLLACARSELRGKNLACWCALDKPCHADVLIRMTNAG